MAIRRGPRPGDRFAQISNAALGDARLSYRARGVLAYLLSRPEGWETTSDRIASQGREGRDAIRGALRELEQYGYLVRVRTHDPKTGRWGHDQFVYDEPPQTDSQAPGLTSGNAASSQVSPQTENPAPVNPSVSVTPRPTKKKNKNGAAGSPRRRTSVTREPATPTTTRKSTIQPTPDQKLTTAGLASPSDRGRFREYLRTVKGARSTEAVIVAATPEDLASQVAEWRRSLDVAAEPDAEPVLCEHGHDVALGAHMCPACDPARQRAAAPSHDVEPDHAGAPMPEWVREVLTGAPALAVPGAFGAPDETTRYGVTPSILAGATSGAHGAA